MQRQKDIRGVFELFVDDFSFRRVGTNKFNLFMAFNKISHAFATPFILRSIINNYYFKQIISFIQKYFSM